MNRSPYKEERDINLALFAILAFALSSLLAFGAWAVSFVMMMGKGGAE